MSETAKAPSTTASSRRERAWTSATSAQHATSRKSVAGQKRTATHHHCVDHRVRGVEQNITSNGSRIQRSPRIRVSSGHRTRTDAVRKTSTGTTAAGSVAGRAAPSQTRAALTRASAPR